MKKLFETDRGISIAVPEDGKVYQCIDHAGKKLYDHIMVEGRGTIITEKDKVRTVFDYYQ